MLTTCYDKVHVARHAIDREPYLSSMYISVSLSVQLSDLVHDIVAQGVRQPLSPGQHPVQSCITDQVSKGHHVEVGCHRLSSGAGSPLVFDLLAGWWQFCVCDA